jgi:hypothetical protein
MAETVDNSLLLEILKEIRKEQRDQRTLLLLTSEHVRKLDQLTETRLLAIERKILNVEERISGLKDDLELMLKSELLGSLGNFETRIESLIESRLAHSD